MVERETAVSPRPRSRRGHCLLVALLLTISLQAQAFTAAISDQESIRVRISKLAGDSTQVSGLDLRFTGHPQPLTGYHAFKVRWERPLAPGLPLTWIVTDRDRGTELARLKAKKFEIFGTNLRVGVKSVPTFVQLAPSDLKARSIDVVAQLDLETYLAGVLPSEMPASWPLESLKAQAVAARTFALWRKSQRKNPALTFDVESDVMDQVFRQPQAGLLKTQRLSNVERALKETRSVILEDSRRRTFQAYFHADCGGQTEEASNVWGSGEKMGTAKDGACPLNPRARWTTQISGVSLSQKLGALGASLRAPAAATASSSSAFSKRRVTSIEILKTTASGRIDTLQVAFNAGDDVILSGHAFRMALGFDQIKSTQFAVSKTGGDFIFKGIGYGHGVGLCQWGARELAKAGKSYQQILSHYYPKASLVKLSGELDSSPEVTAELASAAGPFAPGSEIRPELRSPRRL